MPDLPVAKLNPAACYASIDEAAVAAFAALPSSMREAAGVIYQRTGAEGLLKFCASHAVDGTGDNFALRSEPGQKVAALYHTHPEGDDSGTFSPHDVRVSNQLKRTSYIRDGSDGTIRRYDPGVSPTSPAPRNGRLEAGARISKGEPLSRRDTLSTVYDLQTLTNK